MATHSHARPLTHTERLEIERVIWALRGRKGDAYQLLDDTDLDAYRHQLEIVKVVGESSAAAPDTRHLLLDNWSQATASVAAGRLEVRDGIVCVLYEDPGNGLLTEVRWDVYRGPEIPPDLGRDPAAASRNPER